MVWCNLDSTGDPNVKIRRPGPGCEPGVAIGKTCRAVAEHESAQRIVGYTRRSIASSEAGCAGHS